MSASIAPIYAAGNVKFGAERRTSERAMASMQAILRYPDRPQAVAGSVCDISIGGTGFLCQQHIAANSKCTLQFELPQSPVGNGRIAPILAVVVSSTQVPGQASLFRVNVRFTVMPPATRMQIEHFVQQASKRV